MTTLSTLLLATLVSHAGEAIPKADYTLELDPYDIQFLDYQFPSGLRILFQEEHSQPIVTVVNVIDKGSEMDPLGSEGVAHLIEHLAFRARHGDLPKNWDLLHQLGASINAYTNVDETLYATVAPADSVVPLLRIEALRLKDAVANVTEQDVDAEKSIVRNELRQSYENAAVGEGIGVLDRQLYPEDWPYHRSTIGTHESISTANLSMVRQLTHDNYTAPNSTIVVVGDFKLDQAGDFIKQAFGDMPELLADPAHPDAPLELVEPVARIDCDARPEPPAPNPDPETPRVKGMVDVETVLLGWSLPGGYCVDQPVMEFAANQLTSFIYYTLVPSWEWDDVEQSIDGLGCFLNVGATSSQLICYIEPQASGGYSGERLIRKAADALYLQWERENPELKPFQQRQYQYAKMAYMASVLQSVDLVASLFEGRAFDAAKMTHYTADPRYFSRMFQAISKVQPEQVQDLARRYITRDRMVSVIIEPLDEEERARREAASKRGEDTRQQYSATTRDREYEFAFDFEAMTDDKIKSVTVVPDRSKMREFTLDNGLKVVLMPHGEAPMAHVGLLIHGDDETAPEWGMDSMGEALSRRGYGKDERELAVAAFFGESGSARGRLLTVSGSSANLDALLHTVRWKTGHFDWRFANRAPWLRRQDRGYKRAGEEPDTWAGRIRRERLYGPDSPLGYWWTAERREAQRSWDNDSIKNWMLRKYQPANGMLVITGKIDPDEAEKAVRTYFEGWEPAPGVEVGRVPYLEPDDYVPERQVLIFDKPTATQSQVVLACPLAWESDEQDATAQVMSDVLDEEAWRRLREEKGVTYGASASVSRPPEGRGTLFLYSLVQNDATGFAVSTFFDLVRSVHEEGADPTMVTSHKWSRGRRYVLGQQSGSAMLRRLLGQDDMGYFDMYRDTLAAVDGADFPAMIEPCVGHEVVTVVGPREHASRLLDERGIPYEVVDWEALLESTLTPKELKKRQKAKAKEEAAKADD